MPPTKTQQQSKSKAANPPNKAPANDNVGAQQGVIPDHEMKQNAGVSASMALQAGQKAWELRQAAHGAGDAKAREEILAKAINKEIEAESFGKAAKYTQSGAFQGLAAGAGLGVQPGVTIGKLTGALVGGLVSTVTGLLGGGVGSVYGAMSGPFWDLGEMASQGVQGVVGDFLPDIKSSPSQKKALEKMVMQAKETQAPSREQLEQMKNDAPDQMPQSWSQSTNEIISWRPKMPSMPSANGVGGALGLGEIGAAINPWGAKGEGQQQQQQNLRQPRQQTQRKTQKAPVRNQQPAQKQTKQAPQASEQKSVGQQPSKHGNQQSTPSKETAQVAPKAEKPRSQRPPTTRTPQTPQSTPQPTQQKQPPKPEQSSSQPAAGTQSKPSTPESQTANNARPSPSQPKCVSFSDDKENNSPPLAGHNQKRKPRKLGQRSVDNAPPPSHVDCQRSAPPAAKKAPRKLESRKPTTA